MTCNSYRWKLKKKGRYRYARNNLTLSFALTISDFRVDYLEKSKHLQDQLRDLRSEIEVLKVGEKQSEFDIIHDEQVRMGENKYSTLKRVNQLILAFLSPNRNLYRDSYQPYACFIFKIMQWKLTFIYPVGTLLFNKVGLQRTISVSDLLFMSNHVRH